MSVQLLEFTYSVVGTNDDCELVNCFGAVAAGCQEYARRYGVECFRKNWPNGQIIMAGAFPVADRSLRRPVTVKP